MTSAAQQIYDSLNEEVLKRWREEKKPETLHLEYKTLANSTQPFSNWEDKRNLAKTMSAFANAEGGVILWGVDERKVSDDEMVLAEFVSVGDISKTLRKLEERTPEASSPPVPGVVHKSVKVNGETVIATLVPASDEGPHMAKLRENRYYQRSGGSSLLMEHSQVADMFGRRPQPKLALAWYISGGIALPSKEFHGHIAVTVTNTGRGIARFPSAHLRLREECQKKYERSTSFSSNPRRFDFLPQQSGPGFIDDWYRYGGGINHVIHPELSIAVSRYRLTIPVCERGDRSCAFELEYKLYCEGAPSTEGELNIPREQIREEAFKMVDARIRNSYPTIVET